MWRKVQDNAEGLLKGRKGTGDNVEKVMEKRQRRVGGKGGGDMETWRRERRSRLWNTGLETGGRDNRTGCGERWTLSAEKGGGDCGTWV